MWSNLYKNRGGIGMTKKSTVLIIIIALTLLITTTVVFANTYSPWSDKYSGVQYQYVNSFGGSDWDGLHWYNSSSSKVEVTYALQLSNGSKTNNLITLKPDETSDVIAIAKGARVASISVKAIK
jgi:hypothetical protein